MKLWVEKVDLDVLHDRYRVFIKATFWILDEDENTLVKETFISCNSWHGTYISHLVKEENPKLYIKVLEDERAKVRRFHEAKLVKLFKEKIIVSDEYVRFMFGDTPASIIKLGDKLVS